MILTSTLRKLIEQDKPVYVVTIAAYRYKTQSNFMFTMPEQVEVFGTKNQADTFASRNDPRQTFDYNGNRLDIIPVVVKMSARTYVNQYPQYNILSSKLKAGE